MIDEFIESERKKYEKVFSFPGYGAMGHGRPIAQYLIERSKPTTIADLGCGRGGSFEPYLNAGYKIIPVDHCDVMTDENRNKKGVLPFWKANLWNDDLPVVDYAICTDVMEHIPEARVTKTVSNIARSVKTGCLWSICHVKDVWGDRIGDRLHMTIQPLSWWENELRKFWKIKVLQVKGATSIIWT